jgi:hypothetical protein
MAAPAVASVEFDGSEVIKCVSAHIVSLKRKDYRSKMQECPFVGSLDFNTYDDYARNPSHKPKGGAGTKKAASVPFTVKKPVFTAFQKPIWQDICIKLDELAKDPANANKTLADLAKTMIGKEAWLPLIVEAVIKLNYLIPANDQAITTIASSQKGYIEKDAKSVYPFLAKHVCLNDLVDAYNKFFIIIGIGMADYHYWNEATQIDAMDVICWFDCMHVGLQSWMAEFVRDTCKILTDEEKKHKEMMDTPAAHRRAATGAGKGKKAASASASLATSEIPTASSNLTALSSSPFTTSSLPQTFGAIPH